jgi:large subunit ribosomal protein L1
MAKKSAPPPPETEAAAPTATPERPPVTEAVPVSVTPAAGGGSAAPTEIKKKTRPGRGTPRGKKLKNHLKNQQQKLAKEGPAPLKKAVSLLKSMKRAKFDETVEVHMWLGIDPTQSDQLVRGAVSLPHGIGKSVRIAVFCQADNIAKAKEAGADFAGAQELIEKVQKENLLDFDVALATQDMMGQVSRLGKVLGPRGLMPTPKAGTVIPAGGDVAKAVKEFKAGKVEYRADKSGNIHAGVGKMSFDENKIVENATVFIDQVRAAKPSGVKGHYIKSVTLSATMSPGIPLQV